MINEVNNSHVFDKEISYIKNESYKKDLKFLISKIPSYFYQVPASSTGKYHPSFSLGDGGLVRHTKAAVKIAYSLLNNPVIGNKYTSDEQDIMLIGLIMHDTLKSGIEKSEYTVANHPLLSANLILENKNNLSFNDEELELLTSVIKSHMGPWNKDYQKNEILPLPKTKYQNFVHMCDYLSSQKFLDIKFDNNEIVE